jgi:hypothetical protein
MSNGFSYTFLKFVYLENVLFCVQNICIFIGLSIWIEASGSDTMDT